MLPRVESDCNRYLFLRIGLDAYTRIEHAREEVSCRTARVLCTITAVTAVRALCGSTSALTTQDGSITYCESAPISTTVLLVFLFARTATKMLKCTLTAGTTYTLHCRRGGTPPPMYLCGPGWVV